MDISDIKTEEQLNAYLLEDAPKWITKNLETWDVDCINRGGCESGAYMPAVTYYDATQLMHTHGEEVIEFIYDELGEVPQPSKDACLTFGGICVFYMSLAVEQYCSKFADCIEVIKDNTTTTTGTNGNDQIN